MLKKESYWNTQEKVDYYISRLYECRNWQKMVSVLEKLVALGYRLPCDQMIDLGCGPGNTAAEVITVFPFKRLLAIDLSEEMLNQLPWFVDIEKTRTTLQCDDLVTCKFNVENDSSNLVVSEGSLNYLPSLENVVHESIRVLKPGGIFLFTLILHSKSTADTILWDDSSIGMEVYVPSRRHFLDLLSAAGFVELVESCTIDVSSIIEAGFEYGLFLFSKK